MIHTNKYDIDFMNLNTPIKMSKTTLSLILIFWGINCIEASSQIITDTSLGEESSIVLKNQIFNDRKLDIILGGKQLGNNLFHSFSQFNIPASKRVIFSSNPRTKNIFARITSEPSVIRGFLGVNGTQNLILINPNGINFKDNFKIGIAGSFIPSTASRLNFDNGDYFNTSNLKFSFSNIKPIEAEFVFEKANSITISNTPISFLQQPFIDFIPVPQQINGIPQGLTSLGDKLVISAGYINLNQGAINTIAGDIEIHAIKNGKLINNLNTWETRPFLFNKKGNINLRNTSQINSFSQINAYILLSSKRLNLIDGSYISHFQLGDNSSINGKNKIEIISEEINLSSFLNTKSLNIDGAVRAGILSTASIGKGGNIIIRTNNISAILGSGVLSQADQSGKAGNIIVNAKGLVEVDGSFPNTTGFSGIGSVAYDNATAGNVDIITNDLKITDAAAISTYSFFEANNSDINVKVHKDLVITGTSPTFSILSSRLQSVSFSTKQAGNVRVTADNIFISDGGGIGSASNITGDTGFVQINASKLEIEGQTTGQSSRIFSAIEPPNDFLTQQIANSIGLQEFPVSGNAQNLELNIDEISISNGAEITVRNTGKGDAGKLLINADKVKLEQNAQISALTKSGDGGNISLDIDLLTLSDSLISSSAQGPGTGGNISVNSSLTALNEESRIEANAENNRAGNIVINTTTLLASPGSKTTTTSNLGPQFDGRIEADIQNTQLIKTIKLAPLRPVNTKVSQICGFDGNRLSATSQSDFKAITENPNLITAWGIQQRYLTHKGKYFRDIKTGEIKSIRPVLALEYMDNGEIRSIYEPGESEYVLNLISSLERKCSELRST